MIFDNTPIKFVEGHKHLGITFSQNGQWHTHIEQIANTASKILGIMRKLKYTLSRNALNQIYLYHLSPIIEYASLVWDGCTQQDSNTLQKIQNEAARIVTGLTRSVSLVKLYNECGWTNLSVRRHQLGLRMHQIAPFLSFFRRSMTLHPEECLSISLPASLPPWYIILSLSLSLVN